MKSQVQLPQNMIQYKALGLSIQITLLTLAKKFAEIQLAELQKKCAHVPATKNEDPSSVVHCIFCGKELPPTS